MFLAQTFHHTHVGRGVFGVLGVFIVTGSTSKVGAHRVLVARQGAIGDTIAILVEITTPIVFDLFEVFFPKDLAAIQRSFGVFEWLAHPLVHAHVQVAEHKDRGLQPFGNIQRFPAKFETFIDITRQKDDGVRVAVTDEVREG